MKVAFNTLGCKVNTYETEAVWEMFKQAGFEKVEYKDIADVYIINTCTVTNQGDSKSRKVIRQAIRRNPEAIVVVMGCYSQVASDEIIEIDGVDIVIGTKYRDKILEYVLEFKEKRKPIVSISDILKEKEFEDINVLDFSKNTRAFLKIQEGCNNFCTFCIIPFARGLLRSKPKDSVIKQIKELVSNGYKEVVLTGIHTAGYGAEFNDYDFTMLLNDILKIKGLERLRISSIEASQITDGIIELLKNNKIIANHLHIPLQSGSDEILKQMRRKYTKEEYLNKINKIREVLPNIAITTDIIVGFPGETDELFKEMYDFINEVKFSELHIFPYSKRNGTPAAKMQNQVAEITKTFRVNELLKLNEELALNYSKNFINKELKIIVESNKNNNVIGYSSNYLKIKVENKTAKIGDIIKIKLVNNGYPINIATNF